MANIKFSDFTASAAIDQTDSFLVGFDNDGGGANPTNNKWTFPEVAVGLAAVTATPYSIYAADGTIGTTRKALITDTVQFRDSGDTSDIFTLNTDGVFALGKNVTVSNNSNVAIGRDTNVGGINNVGIGRQVTLTAGNPSYAIAIGYGATTGGSGVTLGSSIGSTESIAIGHSVSSGEGSVCVGHNSGQNFAGTLEGDNMICIGKDANYSSGVDNSIVLNASGSTTDAAVNTSNTFSVHMSSNTTPDFKVVGGGESTLNTSFKITGQAYTELHTGITNMTFDWNDGNIQSTTMGASTPTFTPSNPKAGATYILTLAQTGTVTPTWTGIKWPAATAPTLSGAGKTDVITLICYDATGSGLYYGNATLDFTT